MYGVIDMVHYTYMLWTLDSAAHVHVSAHNVSHMYLKINITIETCIHFYIYMYIPIIHTMTWEILSNNFVWIMNCLMTQSQIHMTYVIIVIFFLYFMLLWKKIIL